MIFFIFQSVIIVKADDDDDDNRDYKEHERYERYEGDENDHDEWEEEEHGEEYEEYDSEEDGNRSVNQENQTQPSYWNIWTRDTNSSSTENLPFNEAKEIAVELNGKTEYLYVFPFNGQMLVSGEKMAQLLNLEHKFYKQSRILVVSKGKEELVVRAGSNAAYENMIKTPMPTNALYFEKSTYLPISVIANAFGYRVNWNAENETIVLEKI